MRWRATIEIVSMLAAIVLFIWWVRAAWPWAWVMPFVLMVVSTPLRREFAVAPFGWMPALAVLAVAAAIVASGRIRTITAGYALGGFVLYCLWGLLQQYILNAFFVRRLEIIAPRPRLIPPAAAALFGVLHWPNPFLVAVAFAGGWLASRFYLRHRGIVFLGMAHGIIGTALFLAVPDDITHHLNVGPGYVRICDRLHGGTHLWLVAPAMR